jgi:hypothetical protein
MVSIMSVLHDFAKIFGNINAFTASDIMPDLKWAISVQAVGDCEPI